MRTSRWLVPSAIVAGLAILIALSLQHAGAARAGKPAMQGDKIGKARPPKSKPNPVIQRAARLARPGIVDEGVNMLQLSRQVFDLDEDQKEQLNDLAEQRNVEARELIKKLNEKYNDRAEMALNAGQKQRFDAITAALRDFRSKIMAALENLEEVGGEPLVEWGRRAGRGGQANLSDVLDLTEQQRRQIKQLESESRAAQKQAQQGVARPTDRTDKEAMRAYRQQLKQAFQKIQQDYKQKVETLFTPEQQEKLEEVQQAMQQYAQAVKQAQRDYIQQIKQSLGNK